MSSGIAVVGMGCSLPGARGVVAFWEGLLASFEPITAVPANRFDVSQFHRDGVSGPGMMASRLGGFIDGLQEFDPAFFGISPREAASMDPQQRLALETAWDALEDAGIPYANLAGGNAAVIIGVASASHWDRQTGGYDVDVYSGTGSAYRGAIAGRISYFLDLRGPCFTIDSLCSSSLTAVHNACLLLQAGETSLALAGGVQALFAPHESILLSQSAGIISPQGRCRFGDAAANGVVRGEGAGMIVLKRLADARRDGDRIYAVIAGSAVTNNGRSGGSLHSPSESAQRETIAQAWVRAGVDPSEIGYVEAHGTGTPTGDAVELRALGAVVGAGRRSDRPCLVGSVKTNIGHLEAAAGVVGLIKATLVTHHSVVPPSLHHITPNPAVPWSSAPLAVPTSIRTLKGIGEQLAVGVNATGLSGTNAHIALVSEDERKSSPHISIARPRLLLVSAASQESLLDLVSAYQRLLPERDADLADICYTAAVRRCHHRFRAADVGASGKDLAMRLAGPLRADARTGAIAFVFPGHGSHWAGMVRAGCLISDAFREEVSLCSAAIGDITGWFLADISDDAFAHASVEVVQPVLWATQMGLAAMWRSWGVTPDAVAGNSVGEVAAACVAGVLTRKEGAAVVCRRSDLLKSIAGAGAMLATGLTLDEAREFIAQFEGKVAVAAENGPRTTVLAGDRTAISLIETELTEKGVFVRPVASDVASHSPQVEPLVPGMIAALTDLQPTKARIPLFSTVTANWVEGTELDSAYWARNLREPVRFTSAVRGLVERITPLFLEVSPHPITTAALAEMGQPALPTMRRGEAAHQSVLETLGELYIGGRDIPWGDVFPTGKVAHLPLYPWRKQRHWQEMREIKRASTHATAGINSNPEIQTDGAARQTVVVGGDRQDPMTVEFTVSVKFPGMRTAQPILSSPPASHPQVAAPMETPQPASRQMPDVPAQQEVSVPLPEFIREVIAQELRMDPAALDARRPLAEYGMDSLMSQSIRKRLGTRLGIDLPATMVFNHPTIEALGVFLRAASAPPAPSGNRLDSLLRAAEEHR